jgi:hypothetical protein
VVDSSFLRVALYIGAGGARFVPILGWGADFFENNFGLVRLGEPDRLGRQEEEEF